MYETEIALFERNKADWCKTHEGEFVVIRGDSVIGFYGSREEAYDVGNQKNEDGMFLLRPVLKSTPRESLPFIVLSSVRET